MVPQGKILIIDDEYNLRRTLARILQKTGCQITAVESGYEALRILNQQRFDLVYLDIHLPEVDGLQILREMRQKEPKLPVILLTGYGSIQSAMEAIRLGATDYLLKPVDPGQLIRRTQEILQEQAVERRKEEIREQIELLQAEMESLEHSVPLLDSKLESPPSMSERFLQRGNLTLDLQAQKAVIGDSTIDLPPSTFDYLVVLSRYTPEVIDYQTLVNQAQNYQVEKNEARELAKWHIHVLRQALETYSSICCIVNVRGIGYRLLVD